MPAPTPLAVTFVLALALGLPAHAQTAAAIADGLGQRGTPADPSAPAAATPTSDSATDEVVAAFIGDYVAQAVERGQIPGAALVVVRRGRVILGRGYGVADYDDGRPVLIDETLFHQASISKTFIWLLRAAPRGTGAARPRPGRQRIPRLRDPRRLR